MKKMSCEFKSIVNPSHEELQNLSSLYPKNPFCTASYASSRQLAGQQILFFHELDENGIVLNGCLAFLDVGRFNKGLEIASRPSFEYDMPFWQNVFNFCRHNKISQLSVNSFACERTCELPCFPGNTRRTKRFEYVIDLFDSALWNKLSTSHKRNIKKAEKSGISFRQTSCEGECLQHLALVDSSLQRRKAREEHIDFSVSHLSLNEYVTSGAGEFFQALKGETVVSSIFVLTSETGAYYHSGGSLPEGMTSGASHFLMHETSLALQSGGKNQFNLGGAADTESGLARFKKGFGSVVVPLESGDFLLGSFVQKAIIHLRQLREKYHIFHK